MGDWFTEAFAAGDKLLRHAGWKAKDAVSAAGETIKNIASKEGAAVVGKGAAVAGSIVAALELVGIAKEVGAIANRSKKYGYEGTDRIYHNTDYQRVLTDYKMNLYNTYGKDTYNYMLNNKDTDGKSYFNVNKIIDKAVEQQLVSKEDAKLAKAYYDFYEKNEGKEDGWLSNNWRSMKRLLGFNDKLGTNEELAAIQRVAEGCAKIAFPNAVNIDDFLENAYSTKSIPTPEYLSEIDPNTDKLPVPEAKWYTGQEMADLFDINYDPDYYYNLIKRGTEAAVEAQRYQNDQAIAASMLDDAVTRNQYLQSIDNSKADAVIKGSTLGARMANELLANANAANTYATNQADVYNQAFTNIQNAINKDAQAGITANNYYDKNVFQPIGNNIEELYYNDINRIGAIKNYNANIYAANQKYNAAAVQANAEMNAAYDNVVGQINAARNEYKRTWDAYYNSNSNPYKDKDDNLRSLYAFNQTNALLMRNNTNAEVK